MTSTAARETRTRLRAVKTNPAQSSLRNQSTRHPQIQTQNSNIHFLFVPNNLFADEETDCVFQWTDWSPCSQSCGGGQSVRTRDCVLPLERAQGCQGEARQTRECNDNVCPVWTNYTDWSACSAREETANFQHLNLPWSTLTFYYLISICYLLLMRLFYLYGHVSLKS